MLDRAALARMKPDVVLVNTSRGGVVHEDALVDALCTGGLAAAGPDLFAVEPIPADNPLLGLDNAVPTPHVTWYTVDTMRRYLEQRWTTAAGSRSAPWPTWSTGTLAPDRPVNREGPPRRGSYAHRDHS